MKPRKSRRNGDSKNLTPPLRVLDAEELRQVSGGSPKKSDPPVKYLEIKMKEVFIS